MEEPQTGAKLKVKVMVKRLVSCYMFTHLQNFTYASHIMRQPRAWESNLEKLCGSSLHYLLTWNQNARTLSAAIANSKETFISYSIILLHINGHRHGHRPHTKKEWL